VPHRYPETDEVVEENKSDCNLITILPKKILVVDDDPIQLKIAESMKKRICRLYP